MKTIQIENARNWDKMVHAPFRKVVKFDLICMGLGIIVGMGMGSFIATGA